MKETIGKKYGLTEYSKKNRRSRTFLFKIELRQPIRIKESACGSVPVVRISCQYSISPGSIAHGGRGEKCTIVDVLTFVSCTEPERVQLRR
jgi:hypothetical protein